MHDMDGKFASSTIRNVLLYQRKKIVPPSMNVIKRSKNSDGRHRYIFFFITKKIALILRKLDAHFVICEGSLLLLYAWCRQCSRDAMRVGYKLTSTPKQLNCTAANFSSRSSTLCAKVKPNILKNHPMN